MSAAEPPFSPEFFEREDESNDALFYTEPRLLVHIDEQAIAAVSQLFLDLISPDSVVLDLMSSWRSHWPQDHPKERMVGLGLNAAEMQANPDLDEFVIHNVNEDPVLPFEDESFDAVVITVSVQYLKRPVETFRQVYRILRQDGLLIVTFSNRMFPTKAVRIWRVSTDKGRMGLVAAYLEEAGEFVDVHGDLANPETSPPGDPIFFVTGRKESDLDRFAAKLSALSG
ncbi:MAG: methyltransferase domain-containing protein [Chloroflexi bacterium]|nr:methyltransferase domain-containing protein [Chloroflexota bacterium]